MAVVHIPTILRPFAGGAATVAAEGGTVREVLQDIERGHEGLRGRLLDEGGIRPEIVIAVGGEEAFGPDTPVPPGAEVFILAAMAGG